MLTITKTIISTSLISIAVYGCASHPQTSEELKALQSKYSSVQAGNIGDYAPIAFQQAQEEIDKLERMERNRADKDAIKHQQYIAEKKVDTALEIAKQKQAQETIENAEVNRTQAMLSAKEKQLQQAKTTANAMAIRAELAETESQKAYQMAERMKNRADRMSSKAEEMAQTLKDISASTTDRGLVLTMGSILFELNKAELKNDSQSTIARVAEFLNQYPERNVLVEGFTDSSGSEQYNQMLSEKRASRVVDLLKSNGVESNRLRSIGYGEKHPVASNESKSGRQSNRRVELVIAESDNEEVVNRKH